MGLVGRLVLNTIVECTKIYLSAVVASSIIRTSDRQWAQIKEEVFNRMHSFNAEDVNFIHLDPELVSYEPKNIHTEALQVTLENVGKLALEFEVEVKYDGNSGLPYLMIPVGRQTEKDLNAWSWLYVRLSDWIVPLWGEIHVFRDLLFRSTFTFDNPMVAAKHAEGSVNLMDAARSSTNPELRAMAQKIDLARPLSTPPSALPRSVRHKSTGAYGVIESFGEAGKVWVRMAGSEELLEHDEWELEDVT